MSSKPGLKKRRAPLPEEVYPRLSKETLCTNDDESRELKTTSIERHPKTLPLGEPVVDKTIFVSDDPSRRHTYSPTIHSDISKPTRKSVDDINFLSDNEALDVHRSSENVKALRTDAPRYGHKAHKRYSLGDVSSVLRTSTSKTSLQSLNLSERSFSLNSIASSFYSTDYVESQMVDQEDIITLTAHVRNFSDALSKLRNAFSGNGSDSDSDEFTPDCNASEKFHVKAHECLGKVLSNLREVLNQYSALHSNEILVAAGNLISKVKSHNYEESKIPDEFYQSIDQLALVFGSSISDFLMGDLEMSPTKTGEDGDDCGDEFAEDGDDEEQLSAEDMLDESLKLPLKQEALNDILQDKDADLDRVLLKMESGVEFCLQWTKCWSKYVKDIANYVEKRAQLEAEYTKNLTKLAQTTRTSICEESYLPFQSTFFTALDQDLEYSIRCQQTLTGISGSKFMEPLMQKRAVHDRARKAMKDEWTKTCKQLNESAGSVKTSQNVYYKRKQDLEKLNTRQGDVKDSKEDSSPVYSVFGSNKGKKEEELRTKVDEAEQSYTNAIKIANQTQDDAEKIKVRIVTQTKQLVNECDRTFRSVTRKYFDMMHDLAFTTPIHFKTLAESCQGYEPGKQFEEFVRFQQSTARSTKQSVFEFQQYINSSRHPGQLPIDSENSNRLMPSPVKTLPSGQQFSDYEFISPVPSPSSSPQAGRKKSPNGRRNPHIPPSTDDESDIETKVEKPQEQTSKGRRTKHRPKWPSSLQKLTLSEEASSHKFHKIRSPAKCSECDGLAVFNGFECAQCGLICHKKCLANLYTFCTHSRLIPSPMKPPKTFGVPFSEDGGVPVLVTKCVNEINKRGLRVKGIYRVSGVKSRMEGLCQDFETNADSVDLSTQPPHLIASVLKLYIRQLPEPLMTTKLYSELIQLAKESSSVQWLSYKKYDTEKDRNDFKNLLERLKEILGKLPTSNYLTIAMLIKHLHKVSINEQYNQMTPQNLAIVFGPTILRLGSENSTTSLSSLVDMPHQTRVVALLIVNPQLFGDAGDVPEAKQASVSDVESEKNEDPPLPDTLVEEFVSPKKEEEAGMPDLYGARSNRVRGEGLSPMDKLQSTSSDGHENAMVDHLASRIDERIDVKGAATTVFDETEISLPGSLERQSKFLEWTADDGDDGDIDTGQLQTNSYQSAGTHEVGYPLLQGNLSQTMGESPCEVRTTLPRQQLLVEGIQVEGNTVLYPKSSADSSNSTLEKPDEDTPSSVSRIEEDDESSHPRLRSKAFSVSKRSSDPEMLAKRGSALMNAFIVDNNIMIADLETLSRGSSSEKASNDSLHNTSDSRNNVKHFNTFEGTSEVVFSSGAAELSSTVTNATLATDEPTEHVSEIALPSPSTQGGTESIRGRAATSESPLLQPGSSSQDDSSLLTVEGTHNRKRSATYDSDKGRISKNRQDKDEKNVKSERVLVYGARSGRYRISVKDQIKQLEERENSDSARAPSSSSTPISTPSRTDSFTGNHVNATQSNIDTKSSSDKVDGKNNLTESDVLREKTPVRAHEPLSRVRITGGHVDILETAAALLINPPRSPAPHRQPIDETFCALKMDISLESPRTPSSDSSEDDSINTGAIGGMRLNTWSGRGLTPRNSNQAPEFV